MTDLSMPCGVTADLRRHEAKESRDAALWDAYADGIAQGWTDNVMEGGYAFRKSWSLRDFYEDIDTDDLMALLVNTKRDEIVQRQEDIRKVLAGRIKNFFMEHCQDDIWETITAREE